MIGRFFRAGRSLAPEQRLAGIAALALWVTMFLPWYSKTVVEPIRGKLQSADQSLTAFGAFSFVEAAVLLVSVAVLFMLFARGERRAFHLPGGDGLIIILAGVWIGVLVFYRMLDKPGTTGNAQLRTTFGVQWGIFFALAAAVALAWAGTRVRVAHRPEPALAEDPTIANRVVGGDHREAAATRRVPRTPPPPPASPPAPTSGSATRRIPRPGPKRQDSGEGSLSREEAEQLSFDVPPDVERDPFGKP